MTFELIRAGPVTLSGKVQPEPLEHISGATSIMARWPSTAVARHPGAARGASRAGALLFAGLQLRLDRGRARRAISTRFGACWRRGIGFYRVEKLGEGDSTGSLKCTDVDFATELEGFKAAYRHLIKEPQGLARTDFHARPFDGRDPGPFLAAETAPRGVAAYGTVVRNWADYHHDFDADPDFLLAARIPPNSEGSEWQRDPIRMFYFRRYPAEIAKARPDMPKQCARASPGTARRDVRPRFKFAQARVAGADRGVEDEQDQRAGALWRIGHGRATDVDHRYLADIANYWRPGSGTYVEVPNTGHGMDLIGSRAAIRERNRAGAPTLDRRIQSQGRDALAEWIKASLAKHAAGRLGRRRAFADQQVLDVGERRSVISLLRVRTTRRSTSLWSSLRSTPSAFGGAMIASASESLLRRGCEAGRRRP